MSDWLKFGLAAGVANVAGFGGLLAGHWWAPIAAAGTLAAWLALALTRR